jgi:hypothetical protein
MITCHLKYIIDPYQIPAFEAYGKLWIGLVNRMGGTHHGYFLPSEGANNVAYACSASPAWPPTSSTARRRKPIPSASPPSPWPPSSVFLSYERSFLRPVHG